MYRSKVFFLEALRRKRRLNAVTPGHGAPSFGHRVACPKLGRETEEWCTDDRSVLWGVNHTCNGDCRGGGRKSKSKVLASYTCSDRLCPVASVCCRPPLEGKPSNALAHQREACCVQPTVAEVLENSARDGHIKTTSALLPVS